MLFCHSFKNDTAIFGFNKVFNMKWKKNQFGGKKSVRANNNACPLGIKSGQAIARPAQ